MDSKRTVESIIEWAIKGAIVFILTLVLAIHKAQFEILSQVKAQQQQIETSLKQLQSKVGWENLHRIELRLKEDKRFYVVSNAIQIERESR